MDNDLSIVESKPVMRLVIFNAVAKRIGYGQIHNECETVQKITVHSESLPTMQERFPTYQRIPRGQP